MFKQKKLEQKNDNGGGGNDPDNDPDEKDHLPEDNRSMMHIFRKAEGHLLDTLENRDALRNLVKDSFSFYIHLYSKFNFYSFK